MNQSINTKQYAPLAILLLIAAAPTISLPGETGPQVSTQDTLDWNGSVNTSTYNAEGELISTSYQENLVTDEGRAWVSNDTFGGLEGDISYIGLSNASSFTASATRGYLKDEIEATSTNLTRGDANYDKQYTGDGCWEIEATWIADGYVDGIKGTGLFIADETEDTQVDSNVIEVAEASLSPPKVLQSGYEYRQAWSVCFS